MMLGGFVVDDELATTIAEHDRLTAELKRAQATKAAQAAAKAAAEAVPPPEPEPVAPLAEVIGEAMAEYVYRKLEPMRKEIDSLRLEQARLLGQIDVLTAMARPAEPRAGEVVDLPRLGWRSGGH